jgi:lipid II:glycine glycyltransferase (peptidoglycan interpeptide bridge formation enzyme)
MLNPHDHLVVRPNSLSVEALNLLRNVANTANASVLALGVNATQVDMYMNLRVPIFSRQGTMILDLTNNPPDRIWQHHFTKDGQQRNKIRHFEKDGFVIDDALSRENIHTFHKYYEANLRHIGVQALPVSFLEKLVTAFSSGSDRIMLALLRKGEFVAGGLLGIFWDAKKVLYERYFALNRTLSTRYTPAYYLYWYSIKRFYEDGCRFVDFGGSTSDPKSIHFRMKAEFGCRFIRKYRALIPLSAATNTLLGVRSLMDRRVKDVKD